MQSAFCRPMQLSKTSFNKLGFCEQREAKAMAMDMAAVSSTIFNPTSLSHKHQNPFQPINLRTNLKMPNTHFTKFNVRPLIWSSPPPAAQTTLVTQCSTTSKRIYQKSKRSFSKRLPPIGPGDRIDYRNVSLLSRFISEQGKILSRKVNRLTLKQQRLITSAIKQARILSLLPFLNVENQFERDEVIPRATGPRARNK